MTAYKVVVRFKDLKDNGYVYEVGTTFPRAGKVVSDDRIKELSSKKNKRGVKLIEAVKEEAPVVVENKSEEAEVKTSKKTNKKKKEA